MRLLETESKVSEKRQRGGGTPLPRMARLYLLDLRELTLLVAHSRVKDRLMSVSKLQVGQLWKKDGTKDIYLVTRLYSEAMNTMVILRKSGSEGEGQIRVRVERDGNGQTIPGFSPAQEDEKF